MDVSEQDIVVHAEEMPQDPSHRDANKMAAGPLPKWKMPTLVKGRKIGYQVLIRRSVLNDIRAHARGNPEVEVCGVMVGTVYDDGIAPWGFVAANIRGNYASGRNAQVTFTSQTWTDIHQQMEARFPKQRILGWYHSHPGFGIFLSEMDVFIHENFFAASSQVAFVDDPKSGDRGLFVWRGGKPVREDFLVDEDLGPNAPPAETVALDNVPTYDAIAPAKKSAWPIVIAAAAVVGVLAGFAIWWLG
jgi:proteasome lid subunit RPN8/RPN11